MKLENSTNSKPRNSALEEDREEDKPDIASSVKKLGKGLTLMTPSSVGIGRETRTKESTSKMPNSERQG